MKITRSLVIALMALCGWVGTTGQAGAQGNYSAAQQCASGAAYVLYRTPAGGSGGIASIYFATHGDCVNFFAQNPTYLILEVHPSP